MVGMSLNYVKWLGPVTLCTTGLAMSAWSAQPFVKALATEQQAERAAHVDSRVHLDLSAPLPHELAGIQSQRFARGDKTAEDRRFDALGVAMNQTPETGRPEAMVQRFRHEGLSVARLWEGHSGFVSLGLNPKGKPGIWLVQKTH